MRFQIRIRRQRHFVRSVRDRRNHRRHPFTLEIDIAGEGQVRAERDRGGRRRVLCERRVDHTHEYRGRGGVYNGRQRQQAGVQRMRQIQSQSGRRSSERKSGAQGTRMVFLFLPTFGRGGFCTGKRPRSRFTEE